MKSRILLACVLSCALPCIAQHDHGSGAQATLITGVGDAHHKVTTNNPEAQKFFDQGLCLIYGFNHDEAERSFRRAAELDPNMAMAWWGVALAVGPNYNLPVDEAREKVAYDAIQKAQSLASKASPSERGYIEALAKRYTNATDPNYQQLAVAYKDAMAGLSKQYPDDLDAATMYAESIMDLHPWGLWNLDGTPREGTPEILATLESVLKRDPNHMGAIHYYIHATEASAHPERALAGANKLAAIAPSAGHLVHMPAHVYIRTGDYDSAVDTNIAAAKVDESYIKARNVQGIYPMLYYSHNLHFIACAAGMQGRYSEAKQAADRLAAHVGPHLKEMPMLEGFMTIPMAVMLRFERWNDILQQQPPPAEMKVSTTLWHYAHGMALAATGKPDQAEADWKFLNDAFQATPEDAIFMPPFNNHTKQILKIAKDVLGARIASARNDTAKSIRLLEEAVATQDLLNYGEPPDWYYPVRESLGGVLLRSGNATKAEQVFRADLERNPRNGRSLFGLMQALKAEGREQDAELVNQQFQSAWKNADMQLEVAKL
ncbi:MAG: tetratricopeptide repeat protein [Acidobacteriaceae bacterium]|nr:tetratricopeptide repeat protein [Acidobacteriaceae bacterium]